jgi:transcriptional regulator with XRE-family HTH domain
VALCDSKGSIEGTLGITYVRGYALTLKDGMIGHRQEGHNGSTACVYVPSSPSTDHGYISGLELGQRNPTVVTLWHLAKALDVAMVCLFEERPKRTR